MIRFRFRPLILGSLGLLAALGCAGASPPTGAGVQAPSPTALVPPGNDSLPDVPFAQGDAARGEEAFRRSPCMGCHTVRGSGGVIGPDLTAVGARAESRAQATGLARPELYLVQSIVDPRAYVVEGYAPVMPNWQDMSLDERALADVVAYLLTLTGP
ncbi:MAG: cytochrome c [Chloroflexi bacterium]|nr:cytochrome c [Chloroflexota bacterium]